MTALPKTNDAAGSFEFVQLPYAKNALEPHIGAQTMELHHGKHYKGYIDKANELVKGTEIEGMPLEQAVVAAHKKGAGPLFNNIGQAYNHYIFWLSMKPNGGGQPPQALLEKINESFGSFDAFKEQFVNTGIGQFGSGWVWLAYNNGKLEVTKSANGESPLLDGKTPLLGCDVWEHAYYLDYQNRRPDYLKTFLDKVANWDFATENLTAACGTGCKG